MASSKTFWTFEHLFFPAIIVFFGIMLNNHYQDKRRPNVDAYAKQHRVMNISEDRFEMTCPFVIINKGGSSINNKKITLLIPRSGTINKILISEKYKSFYNRSEGGIGKNYVIFSIDLPKKRSIEGTIIFDSNVAIPENSMQPLNIIY